MAAIYVKYVYCYGIMTADSCVFFAPTVPSLSYKNQQKKQAYKKKTSAQDSIDNILISWKLGYLKTFTWKELIIYISRDHLENKQWPTFLHLVFTLLLCAQENSYYRCNPRPIRLVLFTFGSKDFKS